MKLYISGVGVGMGPIAFIARDLGYEVVCSDIVEHDIVSYMREYDFTVHIGQDGNSIAQEHENSPIDWLVHTAALKPDHAELTYAREHGIRVTKRDEFINEFLKKHSLKMLAIAGTHGKTNTTAMTVWALQQAGVPISYSIGAQVPFGPFGKFDPESEYFIYEADEFDRNFLQYSPAISIVTNIDFDHPDTYVDQFDYDQAFSQFINASDAIYVYSDDFNGQGDRIHVFGKDEDESSTSLPGVYIRQNARLVLEMLKHEFEIDYSLAQTLINNFPGASRRMEKLANNLYTDYAHHPDEIAATIQSARELSDSVIAVYQPHQNIRQHEVLESYDDCFEGAEKIYWLPTYLSREREDLDVLTPEDLIANLSNSAIAEVAQMDDALRTKIRQHLKSGSLILGMAAGDLDHWLRELA